MHEAAHVDAREILNESLTIELKGFSVQGIRLSVLGITRLIECKTAWMKTRPRRVKRENFSA